MSDVEYTGLSTNSEPEDCSYTSETSNGSDMEQYKYSTIEDLDIFTVSDTKHL